MQSVQVTTKVNIKVGDRLLVNHNEGWGDEATVVELRNAGNCNIKVSVVGQPRPFWIFDSEISEVL